MNAMNGKSAMLAILLLLVGLSSYTSLGAEPAQPRHRVVFELTSDDPRAWHGVLNNVEAVQQKLRPAAIELVLHGNGLAMLQSTKNADVRRRMEKSAKAGVVFAACENAMKRQGIKKDQLVPFASTVPSGVVEVVTKQEAGWSYLRAGP